MEQPSVSTQTSQARKQHPNPRFRWIHHFLTEDTSPYNHTIIELQRRMCWIVLALTSQSLNQVAHSTYLQDTYPFVGPLLTSILGPFGPLNNIIFISASIVALWMALRPALPKQQTWQLAWGYRYWRRFILVLTLILFLAATYVFAQMVVLCLLPPQFSNDGTSLDTNAAILLVQGRNPYTDSSLIDLEKRFAIQPTWTTPLHQGQFAQRLSYPSDSELSSVFYADLNTGHTVEFESKVSYPALSFLTLVPFAWFKDYNVLPLYLLSYLLLIAIAWKFARREMHPWILVLGFANYPMWASVMGGNLDILCILLLVLAWLLRDHRWASAILLGLAVATKQIAWLFLPFYLILTWRRSGFLEMADRLAIAVGIALAINLPFILLNPHAWTAGVLAPIKDPMFPLGDGIISLSINHLLPFFPTPVYSVLEVGALLLCLAWYWRICQKYPEAVMLLAVLPLLFAWRSLSSYFYYAAYSIVILIAAKDLPGKADQFGSNISYLEKLYSKETTGEIEGKGVKKLSFPPVFPVNGLKCASVSQGAKWMSIRPENLFCSEFLSLISPFARFV
jgi:uncharacterized membrane protein